ALVTDGPVWVASLAAPPHNEESVWFPLGRTTGFLVTGQAASPHRNNQNLYRMGISYLADSQVPNTVVAK
ncbi:MAG: hypothetical protein PUE58_03140, partial [Lachnospiraceae bacterium]|nr:hypothetical protein [Lachnospiraceae bacterium]